MSGEGRVVCVTGASGHIASWIVKHLLQRGYAVRATVRDPHDPKKTDYLRRLDGAKERLNLFKADLLDEGSFDAAVDGCEGVFHTASPVLMSSSNPQVELFDPAVKGTLNVLKSCAKFPSVKRVVITSSMASVVYNGKPLSPDVVVDETWYSDLAYCQSIKYWYAVSKILAEEAAWKFAKENGIDVVTIHPGFTIGPVIQPTVNATVQNILRLVNGARTFPNANQRFVDVRDIANAHINAFELPSASGRYCLVGKVAHFSEILKIVLDHYPNLRLPERCEDDRPFPPNYQVSQEKAKSLGIDFIPLEVTVTDTIESLKEKGFLKV